MQHGFHWRFEISLSRIFTVDQRINKPLFELTAHTFLAVISILVIGACSTEPTTNTNRIRPEAEQLQQTVLPELLNFSRQQQKNIMKHGRALNRRERKIATDMGINKIETVKIWAVRQLPKLEGTHLTNWADKHRLNSGSTAAYTFGHGIVILKQASRNKKLLAHELTHVRQMEQMGLENYLRRYIEELEAHGYSKAPLEIEAQNAGRKYRH